MKGSDSIIYIEKNKIYQPYDKIFRKILSNETQVVELINNYFKLKWKITEKDFERYHCKFVNTQFQNRESDVIYKLRNTNIIFLIEHQSKIDYMMSKRIAEYQIEIIKLETLNKKNNKKIILPLIIPIILYTNNKRKWNANQTITKMQPRMEGYKNLELGGYNIIDINKISIDRLLHNNLFILKILGLEKAKNEKELGNIFQYILFTEENEANIELLREIAYYVYDTVLKNEKVKEKFDELNRSEGNMSFIDMLLEREKVLLAEGKKEGIKQGVKQGEREIVRKMLEYGSDDKFIKKVTKIDAKTLRELKEQKGKA